MGLSMKLFFMRINNPFNSPTKEAGEKDSDFAAQKFDRSARPLRTSGTETGGFPRGPLREIGALRRSDESGVFVQIGDATALFDGLRGRRVGEGVEGKD
jgi:hypothetical protein